MSIGVTRVNGGLVVGDWVGRPQTFVAVTDASDDVETNFGSVDSNAEKLMRAVETFGTINMVGTASGNAMTFMVDATTLGANATVLAAAVQTAVGGAGTAAVSLLTLSGVTLA